MCPTGIPTTLCCSRSAATTATTSSSRVAATTVHCRLPSKNDELTSRLKHEE
jgi:hypothetical protein